MIVLICHQNHLQLHKAKLLIFKTTSIFSSKLDRSSQAKKMMKKESL